MSKPDRTTTYKVPQYRGPPAPRARTGTSLTTHGELLYASTSSPMSLLGIGQVDPFGVYPSELPVHIVSPALAQRQ